MDLSWLFPLVIGGAISLLSSLLTSWFQSRREVKRRLTEREERLLDKKSDVDREYLETVRGQIVDLYLTAREQIEAGERNRITFDSREFFTTETRGYLIADPELRAAIGGVLGSLRGLGPAVEMGLLEGHPVDLQAQVLYSCIQLLSAKLRGDALPPVHLARVLEVGAATQQAWQAMMTNGEAKKVVE